MNDVTWEIVVEANKGLTSRLKVDGGYIYQSIVFNNEQLSNSLCFVPDVDLQRYQSHLRDAYNQGFKDGSAERLSDGERM